MKKTQTVSIALICLFIAGCSNQDIKSVADTKEDKRIVQNESTANRTPSESNKSSEDGSILAPEIPSISDKDKDLFKQAIDLKDSSKCDLIENQDYSIKCKKDISSASQPTITPVTSVEEVKTEAISSQLSLVIQGGDYLKCSEFEGLDKESCILNTLTLKAISTNDSSWCQKSDSKEIVDMCLSSFNKK